MQGLNQCITAKRLTLLRISDYRENDLALALLMEMHVSLDTVECSNTIREKALAFLRAIIVHMATNTISVNHSIILVSSLFLFSSNKVLSSRPSPCLLPSSKLTSQDIKSENSSAQPSQTFSDIFFLFSSPLPFLLSFLHYWPTSLSPFAHSLITEALCIYSSLLNSTTCSIYAPNLNLN